MRSAALLACNFLSGGDHAEAAAITRKLIDCGVLKTMQARQPPPSSRA